MAEACARVIGCRCEEGNYEGECAADWVASGRPNPEEND
jgi:hypothetical protein